MSRYEYRVVPAPRQPARVKGLRAPEDRYGHGLEEALNLESRLGWEFQRIETVPVELRRGWLSRSRTETVTLMVFRRALDADIPDAHAEMWEDPAPRPVTPPPSPAAAPVGRRSREPVLRPPGGPGRE